MKLFLSSAWGTEAVEVSARDTGAALKRAIQARVCGARACVLLCAAARRSADAGVRTVALRRWRWAAWRRRGVACSAARLLRLPGFGADTHFAAACARARVQARRGVPVEAQRLSFCGGAVRDDVALAAAGVHAHATLRLSLRTRGACVTRAHAPTRTAASRRPCPPLRHRHAPACTLCASLRCRGPLLAYLNVTALTLRTCLLLPRFLPRRRRHDDQGEDADGQGD
jgi:hypothetical protein